MSNLTNDLTKEIPVTTHMDDVDLLANGLLPFHRAREFTYQMSFAKRGEIGIWMNLARKYDRIDNLARHVFEEVEESAGVSLVDTLVDLALYSLKWLAVIKQLRPEDLEKWIDKVYCHDTSTDPEAAKAFIFLGHVNGRVDSLEDMVK